MAFTHTRKPVRAIHAALPRGTRLERSNHLRKALTACGVAHAHLRTDRADRLLTGLPKPTLERVLSSI